ncbi:O-antigen ligase family protein [Eisenbergiella sp.]
MNINDVFQDFTLLSGVDLFYKGNKEYFIASDNFMGYYLVPIMTIIACTFLVKKQKITIMGWTLLGITVINIMMVWSGTGVFGCCLFMLLLSFSVCKRKSTERKEIINCKNLIILYIALYLLIVVFQAGNLFSFITEGLLHKSANFTGRTNLWSEALRQIFDSPISLIIGHGGASGGRFIIAGLSSGNAPHNLLLDVACQFGIMGVFCYLKMFYVAIKKLKTYEETLIGKTITFALFSQFIMYLTEGTYLLNTLQYILITLTWNIDVLLKTEKS